MHVIARDDRSQSTLSSLAWLSLGLLGGWLVASYRYRQVRNKVPSSIPPLPPTATNLDPRAFAAVAPDASGLLLQLEAAQRQTDADLDKSYADAMTRAQAGGGQAWFDKAAETEELQRQLADGFAAAALDLASQDIATLTVLSKQLSAVAAEMGQATATINTLTHVNGLANSILDLLKR